MKIRFGFLLFLLTCGLASAQTPDCNALTHQALELSGYDQSIDHLSDVLFPDAFLQQIRGRESGEEFLSIFKPIMMKEFDGGRLRKEIQERVAARCNPEQMAQTVEKLKTPFIARMLELEAASNTPEGQQKLQRYINIARTVPPTDDRIEALDALDASAGSSDYATDSIIAVMRGMMTGVGAPPEVVAQLQARRREIKTQMQNAIELGMSVTYHGVTRPELQQYARELASQPLKGFYSQVNRAFVEILEERSRALGQEMKKAMVARKQN
jgi:hypothetical protein